MQPDRQLKLILPKGRIQEKVLSLLARIGIEFSLGERSYRPGCNNPAINVKLLKPQNIPKLVELGRHDCGFTGYDWIVEQDARVTEMLDTGFDPVELVAAAPEELAEGGAWRTRSLVVASEYRSLTEQFIREHDLKAIFLQTYGATEAMPPEDADLIVDNTATGATLRRNRLEIVDRIMSSSTRFIACDDSIEDPWKQETLEQMTTLMRSALMADSRVLLEMNVLADRMGEVVNVLPCMRSPTVSPLHGDEGFAVKAAVPAGRVPSLIPRLVAAGARDILEYRLEKIVETPNGNGGA
jgi:ATP phosphoribosyltransferase